MLKYLVLRLCSGRSKWSGLGPWLCHSALCWGWQTFQELRGAVKKEGRMPQGPSLSGDSDGGQGPYKGGQWPGSGDRTQTGQAPSLLGPHQGGCHRGNTGPPCSLRLCGGFRAPVRCQRARGGRRAGDTLSPYKVPGGPRGRAYRTSVWLSGGDTWRRERVHGGPTVCGRSAEPGAEVARGRPGLGHGQADNDLCSRLALGVGSAAEKMVARSGSGPSSFQP